MRNICRHLKGKKLEIKHYRKWVIHRMTRVGIYHIFFQKNGWKQYVEKSVLKLEL